MIINMGPTEQANLAAHTLDLVNRASAAGAMYAEYDRRKEEEIEMRAISKCCTQEELDQLESYRKTYEEALNEYSRYKHHLMARVHRTRMSFDNFPW